MLSSTFTDLVEHRQKAKAAIEKLGFHAVGMESGGAQTADVIDASLRYVREGAAYIGIITKKYGQTPHEPVRNPDERSITELEFDEAMRLKRPILLFIMDDEHMLRAADVERDPVRTAKLEAFTARAKRMRNDSEVERVWEPFESLENFAERIGPAVGNLARQLDAPDSDKPSTPPAPNEPRQVAAPALRALPRYIGSHDFVGRAAELGVLDDWASPSDPHPLLLFEAMGGTGKSMLTWHWLNERAPHLRADWAGRFWYSFYEAGATLAGFCREALGYMTGLSVKTFLPMRAAELGDRLIAELDARPWLLVLDGLERILVGYQRSDAAQLRDEDVDSIRDPLADRDPCLSIRPQDDDLLRRLAGVSQSKLLISTRLTPAKLVNASGQAISGVKRVLLKGLRPVDAEALFRACEVRGDSATIQAFLHANCDGHPLVIGVLAGLVNDYFPDRGNFAAWRDDPAYGGKLDWAALDLVQRRNHILDTAIAALDPMSLRLLQGLALLLGGADVPLLEAINPHRPARPEQVAEPEAPEQGYMWKFMGEEWREKQQADYRKLHETYCLSRDALAAWQVDPAVRAAPRRLADTVQDLERRGLVQYDPADRRYDLHPVVRGVASGRMSGEERASSSGPVIDYCRARSPSNWNHAETLEDMSLGRLLIVVLTRIGAFDEAMNVFRGNVFEVLFYRFEAIEEIASLLRGFFPDSWEQQPEMTSHNLSWLLTQTSITLERINFYRARNMAERVLELDLDLGYSYHISTDIRNLSRFFSIASKIYLYGLVDTLDRTNNDVDKIFATTLNLAKFSSFIGDDARAEELWRWIDAQVKPSAVALYRPGDAESAHAWRRFRQGKLGEGTLVEAERLASSGRNRFVIRELADLRGLWLIEQGQSQSAITSLQHAITMARAIGQADILAEAALALARLRTGDTDGARADAAALDLFDGGAALYVACVWAELGERERAVAAALRAHAWAVADGEPYVYRWELTRARELLTQLDAELPEVPVHDPASLPKFAWEPKLRAMIARIEAENAERDAKEQAERRAEEGAAD